MMWIVAATLLTMGGLLRERAVGASNLTLALPVSRARLMGVRIAAILRQAQVPILVPWTAMFAIGCAFGETHSLA